MNNYGSVTQGDKTYKTVVIDTQTWMAENINSTPTAGESRCYGQGNGNGGDTWLDPIKDAEKIKENCNKYGRLYDWKAAKTVCPSGWHLPDTSDWGKLKRFIEKEIFDNYEDEDFCWDVATKLKATSGWEEVIIAPDDTVCNSSSNIGKKGVDSYGFGAIGTGYCVSCDLLSDASGFYGGLETKAYWWSATEYVSQYTGDKTEAYQYRVANNEKVLTQKRENKVDYLYSVRCVKD